MKKMDSRNIQKTELNGMVLQHTQHRPEIVYQKCVICFIDFNGTIESVGNRVVELLDTESFTTLNTLYNMVDWSAPTEADNTQALITICNELIEQIETAKESVEVTGYIDKKYGTDPINKNIMKLMRLNELLNTKN